MKNDIHAYIEMVKDDVGFSFADIIFDMVGPNLLELINNVPEFAPKGIPNNLGGKAFWKYYLLIDDICACKGKDGYISSEEAKNTERHPNYLGVVINPKWHTPSYMNTNEFKELGKKFPNTMLNLLINACAAAMTILGEDTRLVFWFEK